MKRVIAILLAVLLILQLAPFVTAANEEGSPKHIPRVVSVLFDDSGSMYGSETEKRVRWAYASYAMQAFTAMMGSEDALYVTYLNGSPEGASSEVTLSDGKQSAIDKIEDTMFGGKTPNRLDDGAACLEKEYAKHGASANYYLVVLADGKLDNASMQSELKSITSATKAKLKGAEFETIYFSMDPNDTTEPDGFTCKSATAGNDIVSALQDVSADIMGRTKLAYTVAGGQLSFSLPYPALSMALIVQKENGSFSNVSVPLTKDGQTAAYTVDTYYINCPTEFHKNPNAPKKEDNYVPGIPEAPPSGFVSLIDNGSRSLPKGSYSIDLSAYDVDTEDIVLLAEPAVRIGCQYFLNGDTQNPLTFDQLCEQAREGDEVTVQCGLFEINEDGSQGEAVPLDVLSPSYSVYVNEQSLGQKIGGEENAYVFELKQEFENQELKIEAVLEGYQPFIMKETFGEITLKPLVNPDANTGDAVLLTKKLWAQWVNGEYEIPFTLLTSDTAVLEQLSVKVDGADFLPAGNCSELDNCIRMNGSQVLYKPKPTKDTAFGALPKSFTVSLADNTSGETLLTVPVTVIQPQYKIEVVNKLEGVLFGADTLKNNTDGISYTVTADYDQSGQYAPVQENDCEGDIVFTVDTGTLPCETTQNFADITITPQYDAETDTDVLPEDVFGKQHVIRVSATVDGVSVAAEDVTFAANKPVYKIVVDNPITTAFTLDSIKVNGQKIVFSLQADYTASGNFGAVEAWDQAIYDSLTLTAGELPGKFETEYDAGGNPVGKSFLPLYDENNNGGIPFTAVAGKTHTISAALTGTDVSAQTTVTVTPPVYEVAMVEDGIHVMNTGLLKNEKGVKFTVSRDGRILTAEELGALAYTITYDPPRRWLAADAQPQSSDGTMYLLCKPAYGGWSWPAPGWWNWQTMFMLGGQVQMTLTVGENSAVGTVIIDPDVISLIVFLIVMAVVLILAYIVFCYLTRIRIMKGKFYIVSFSSQALGYKVRACMPVNPSKKSFLSFVRSTISWMSLKKLFTEGELPIHPFKEQTYTVSVDGKKAVFVTRRSSSKFFSVSSYPYADAESNKKYFCIGGLNKNLAAVIRRDKKEIVRALKRRPIKKNVNIKMGKGVYLALPDKDKVILFLSSKEEKKLLGKTNDRRRNRKSAGSTTGRSKTAGSGGKSTQKKSIRQTSRKPRGSRK